MQQVDLVTESQSKGSGFIRPIAVDSHGAGPITPKRSGIFGSLPLVLIVVVRIVILCQIRPHKLRLLPGAILGIISSVAVTLILHLEWKPWRRLAESLLQLIGQGSPWAANRTCGSLLPVSPLFSSRAQRP